MKKIGRSSSRRHTAIVDSSLGRQARGLVHKVDKGALVLVAHKNILKYKRILSCVHIKLEIVRHSCGPGRASSSPRSSHPRGGCRPTGQRWSFVARWYADNPASSAKHSLGQSTPLWDGAVGADVAGWVVTGGVAVAAVDAEK